MSRLKAAQSSGKGTTGEKSQAGKDNAKRAAKRSRKRRRAQDDSRSTSQDKNSTIMPGKQIKITKDKHFLNPNISKMIRKSINDCSHGQEKTVKIGSKNKEKQALEEKKKQLDTFNETIRKNNLRSMQNSKEMRGDSLAASHVNLSSNAAGSPTNPMSNYAKKLNKIMKCKKESDDTHHPKEIGHNSHAEKSSPNKQSVIHVDREVNLKKKASGSVRENPSQNHVSLVPFEPADLKKGPQITFKKVESAVTPKLNSHLQPPNPGESRERTREKSGDERKSSEDMKKKGKGRTRKDPKKERALNAGDDKIKENLQKVNNKAKLAIKHQAKAILKRFNKPRRSKSSIDLMSDQILKQMLGRSDSVNIKPGKTVDQLLQEYKNIVGKDKKGAHPRDATLKDRILKKGFKEKVPIAKQPSNRPIKLKQSKSSKVYKRFESFPMKMKKLTALTSTVPINQLTSHLKHTHASDKSKEREILDTINQMNSKIQKNYDVGPSLGLKSKMPVGTNHGLYMPATTGTKKSKKPKAKGSKKKVNIEQEAGSEDIPVEEKELIDKEILMPKSSSDYANGIYGSKIDKDQLKIDSFVPNNHTEPKKNPLADDNSPKSMRIRDSESSDRENSEKSVHYKPAPDEIDDEDRYSDRDHLNETPRYSQGDLFSKENFDKWMYLLQEFKNCQKNGNVDGELKELLINFCDKTQKGITQLIEEVHQGKRGQIYSDQKPSAHQRDSPTEDDLKRRKKPHLGIDVEKINDEFVKNSSNIQIKDNRSNSFQWLKAEFEQNLQELAKLLGNNKDVTIKKIQEAMKLNERYSEMFELRLSAINERFEAQKEQIEKYNSNEGNNPKSSELMSQLNEWYQAEMSSMDSEKKKITKGWFTSIDTIRKIKRDLEIAAEMKKGFSLKVPSKGHLKQSEDSSSIYGIIAKSLVSPSNKRLDSGNKRSYFRENSPMSSPNDNSVHSHTKIISDPNVRSMKMKQGESLSRRNDDMAKSLEQADFSKSYKGLAEDNYKGQLEISDAKRNIVNEIDDGIHKRQNEDLIEVIKNNQIFTEDPYFASPPHPSIDSSNLYQISPTSIKRQSKPNSSNKPRSTLKSDSAIEDKAKPDDLIWIKDQSKPKIQGVVPGESSQGLDIDKKSSGNSIQRLQTFPKDDFSKTPFSRGSLQEALSPEVPILTHQNLDQNRLDSIFDPNFKIFQSPQESQRKPLIDDDFKGEKDNDRVKSDSNVSSNSQGRITQKTNFTPLMRNEFDATHPPLSSTEGLDSLKKELEKIPRATEYSQPDHSSQKDQLTREGSKRAHGRAQNYEQEDYLNDLTQGIGFDSQVIKNDFEDTKKSTYNLDDFASMSDSERELQKQAERMKKLDVVSEEILDMIFTDTISDIIQMLENENMDFEREIASGYNGQIYLQDGQDQVAPQQIILQRRGIRVNFNAVKEYISLLINFIKGTTSLPKEARQR